MLELLLTGLIDTLIMVGVSAILAFLLGLPIALVLVNSSEQGIAPSFLTNLSLGWSVNIVRAIPFLILMVAIIPATRMIVGTSYGVWAAVVPLTLAATPFFARIAEVSLREVDPGLIEAAQAIGCNRTQIIQHVLLPEALPGIIAGFTVTLVTMINSSAIAGAIGAGGLGDIAYRYGYQRFDVQMLVQATGDSLAQWVDKRQL